MKSIPAMHRVLSHERILPYDILLGRNQVKRAADEVFGRARACGPTEFDALVGELADRLEAVAQQSLRNVINGTGIIIHTNLGRAPLATNALDAVVAIANGYSNIEYDLETGQRGSRYGRIAGVLE